jgi:hypothetical protein
MSIVWLNIFSLFVNVFCILNYLFLQKTKNIKIYTIVCLIASFMLFIKCLLFKDITGAFSEFFWIGISVYGLTYDRRRIK